MIPPAHYYYSYIQKVRNFDDDDGKYLNYNFGEQYKPCSNFINLSPNVKNNEKYNEILLDPQNFAIKTRIIASVGGGYHNQSP